jgi:hypothetical protein
MPIFNILKLDPFTRVNDLFVQDQHIDASPNEVTVRHPLILSGPNSKSSRYQADFYQHAACDFVVETVLDYPYPYLTEKTLRPLASKRMFIILGPMGILKLLRNKGFETFSNFVDERYDTIADPGDRFFAVNEQIHRFCARPLNEIVQYLQDNQHKFDHNFNTLQALQQQELKEIVSKLV